MLQDFEIIQKLGEGAYSTVFKVRRLSDNKIYALKKVRFTTLKEKEKENALTEVRILASVNHPNVIAYKEAFIDPGTNTLCLVMELAENGDLLEKINEHKKNRSFFSEQKVWDIALQATRGVKALHDLKILHRDLKCANLFLMEDETVKIGDMNVSKVAKLGLVYTETGTPYYASPEVWKDNPYNMKSDIWSLGCVIYEMAALVPPFQANNMENLFKKVIRGEYPPLPSRYSIDLNEFIKFLLRVNPNERPDCNRILEHPIVQMKSSRWANDETRSNLLETIYLPGKLTSLSDKLPAPNYKEKVLSYKDLPAVSRSPQATPRRFEMNDGLRVRMMSEKKLYEDVRVQRDEIEYRKSPERSRRDLIIARSENRSPIVKSIQERENEVRGLPPLPAYERPIVRPSWWGW